MFYTINPNVIWENEFLRFLNHKVPTVTPIEVKQEQVRFNPEGGSCENGMKIARSLQLGHPLNWTSSGNGRAGRVFDPARMAELVAWSIQLGHPPSWTVCSVHPSIKRA